jgi:hypothetical protein
MSVTGARAQGLQEDGGVVVVVVVGEVQTNESIEAAMAYVADGLRPS